MAKKSGPRLFRAALETKDGRAAAGFYARLLGLPGRPVGGGRVSFDGGAVLLALVDVSAARRRPRPFFQDLSIAVPDIRAFHARARALKGLSKEAVHGQSGGALATRPRGERSFPAVDPNGAGPRFGDRETLFTGRAPGAKGARVPGRTS